MLKKSIPGLAHSGVISNRKKTKEAWFHEVSSCTSLHGMWYLLADQMPVKVLLSIA